MELLSCVRRSWERNLCTAPRWLPGYKCVDDGRLKLNRERWLEKRQSIKARSMRLAYYITCACARMAPRDTQ